MPLEKQERLLLVEVNKTEHPQLEVMGKVTEDCNIPLGLEKKWLIECWFPSAASEKGGAERYEHGKTPHTIFTWWARRPFASMRGMVATSLISANKCDRVKSFIQEYCTDTGAPLIIQAIKQLIGCEPKYVLDVFAGGGTIPLVAAEIGAHTYAVENNELAYFILLSLLRFSQVNRNLPEIVRHRGKLLLEQLARETETFFPNRNASEGGRTIVYFWSRSTRCPSCGAHLSLQKRPWLSKKRGKSIFLQRKPDRDNKRYEVEIAIGDDPTDAGNAWRGNLIECPFCNHVINREEIDSILEIYGYDELTAFCTTQGRGKNFYVCTDTSRLIPNEEWLWDKINEDLNILGKTLPEVFLPRWSGITNPTLYGIHKIYNLFNVRQLAVLVKYCRLLHDEYFRCAEIYGVEMARAVVAFLSGLIDQLVDWNGRICMWIPQNEQVGRGYSGPGIPMMWDFVEIDPVEHGPANLWDKLERIVAGMKSIPYFDHLPEVIKGDARRLPFLSESFDLVATDPPYFDNLYYHILADCIYVWKRLALGDILPQVFSHESTNVDQELSANRYHHGTLEAAAQFYTEGMATVLSEVYRVLKPNGILALVFAHSSVDGWASILEAFRRARLEMVAAWRMQIERKHRPRGMRSAVVNTSFILVGRKHTGDYGKITWEDLKVRLEHQLTIEYKRLKDVYLNEDIGQSLLGTGVCICAQAGDVYKDNEPIGTYRLIEKLARLIESIVPDFSVARR